MAQPRTIPDFIQWSQSAILTLMNDILSVLSSSSAVAISKDPEILARLDEVIHQLERLNTQLAMETGNAVELGEKV